MKYFLICFLLVLNFYLIPTNGLTLQIEPKTSDCFSQDIGANQHVRLDYQVLRGGLLDIQLQVSQHGVPGYLIDILHFSGEMDGKYEFQTSSSGLYKFCFNNEMSRFTPKVVQFSLSFGTDKWGLQPASSLSKPSASQAVKPEDLDPLERSVRRISMQLDVLQRHQKVLRNRERKHRDTNDSTNSRVVIVSIIESTVLFSLHIFQIYFIRSLFNRKN